MADKKTYAQLNSELEAIVARLQDPDTDIDEAIKLHEQGQAHILKMQTYLKQAELKVKKLSPKSKA